MATPKYIRIVGTDLAVIRDEGGTTTHPITLEITAGRASTMVDLTYEEASFLEGALRDHRAELDRLDAAAEAKEG